MIRLSFRTRLLAIVVAVSVVPLVVLGFWLTRQTARSGEALLHERLSATLEDRASSVTRRWIPYRSSLLDLVETPAVRAALVAGQDEPPRSLVDGFSTADPTIVGLSVLDTADRVLWTLDRGETGSSALFGAPLGVRLAVHDLDGQRLGTLQARLRFSALWGPAPQVTESGAILTARDPESDLVLLPVPFRAGLVGETRFVWDDRPWIGRTRDVAEPRVTLVAAAPVAPFVGPFREAARNGLWVLMIVAGLGLLAATLLTRRLTASLEQLSDAARAVASGELGRMAPVATDDEVGQVARAFNTMVESLRTTLSELAGRESLVAVNEFAASLAHEIRNPLTSVQLDLQQVEETLPMDSELRQLQSGAIAELKRLDRTVGTALETARAGRIDLDPIDLMAPLRAAMDRARPRLARRQARLAAPSRTEPLPLTGDADALKQVFLNLLLNAADALDAPGTVGVDVDEEPNAVVVTVRDDGRGMTEEERRHAFEPFFTTRPGGTGLGLAVARRIVTAHGGRIDIRGRAGGGTEVVVTLPRTGRPSPGA